MNRVPIFSPLSMEQKRLVSNALLEVHFRPGLYICEEVSVVMFVSAPLRQNPEEGDKTGYISESERY